MKHPLAPRLVVALLTTMAATVLIERQQPARAAPALATYTDVTAAAGVRFKHTSGAFGRKYLPETMGSGAAFLDADGDGRQDLLLVNSTNWPGRPRAGAA